MKRRDFLAASILSGGFVTAGAQTGGYPANPVRMIVPFPPGGPADVMGRTVAKAMAEEFNKTFVVENKAGAGGNIGTNVVATAKPDGYTIGAPAMSSLVISPHLHSHIPYIVERDLAPISLIGTTPCAIVVNPQAPFHDVKGLLAYARANPGKVHYGTSGVGTASHLAAEMLQAEAGIKLSHIPYKGSSQIIPDLLSGVLMMSVETSLVTTLQHVRSGKLKMLAITYPERSKEVPDVPTLAESGFPGFNVENWFGMIAPKDTPPEIVASLSKAWASKTNSKEVIATYKSIPANLRSNTPEEFTNFIRAEDKRWGDLIRRIGITL